MSQPPEGSNPLDPQHGQGSAPEPTSSGYGAQDPTPSAGGTGQGADHVACRERGGALAGARGRPEVAGGGWKGAATVRERTVARSRAPIWPAWHFLCLVGAANRVQ